MYGIFVESRTGLNWMANHETLEGAKAIADDMSERPDADFVLVLPVAHFIDVDGERESV